MSLGGVVVEVVPNSALRLDDLPTPEAEWPAVWRFADTFNGYKHWGSFEKCAEVANAERHSTLTELRTCLFFECRRWHHYGDEPDEETAPYIRGLVAKVRDKVAAGELE
jgi:hypothetical protein